MRLEQLLPEDCRTALCGLAAEERDELEEVRLRMGRPFSAVVRGAERILPWNGGTLRVREAHLQYVIAAATEQSPYARREQLSEGYLTVDGGHRIGVCGTVAPGGAMKDFSSVSIRRCRQMRGVAAALRPWLAGKAGSLLILGPPGCGKTTLLRDAVRLLSDELGVRVGLVDERMEVAGAVNGLPQMEVGRQTDVLSGGTKAAGMLLLLRAMNPQWLAVDEITAQQDIEAMVQASYCGVSCIATAHASGTGDLYRRPLYRRLVETGLFGAAAVLGTDKRYHLEKLEGNG